MSVAPPRPADIAAGAVEDEAPTSHLIEDGGASAGDEGAPVGPSEDEESSFLAEQREQGRAAPAVAGGKGKTADEPEPDASAPLPPLDDLVNRIPEKTRELMDELFRARFVTVKRVPKSALKN